MSCSGEVMGRDVDRFDLEGRRVPEELVNDVIRLMARHRSVRAYRPDPLPEGLLEVLVTAAQSASTSSNLQAYSIVAVEDAEKRRLLAEWSKNPFVAQAPLFLAFCPDLHRLEWVAQRQGYEMQSAGLEMFIVAVVDAALAAQNLALAAESLGLGICYIGGLRNELEKVAELLRLPPGTFGLFGMTVGYPADAPRVRHRLPLEVVLHREEYSDAGLDEALGRYDAVTAESGIYAKRRVAVEDAREPEVYGWLEHTARRLARPSASRLHMRERLERLGWVF